MCMHLPMFYSNQQAFLLENVPCNNISCKSVRRMFKVIWELSDLNQIKDAVVATFFDIYEDVSSAVCCSKQRFSLSGCGCLWPSQAALQKRRLHSTRQAVLQPGRLTLEGFPGETGRWAESSTLSLPGVCWPSVCSVWAALFKARANGPRASPWWGVDGALWPKVP